MVEIQYIDGDKESIEPMLEGENKDFYPFTYEHDGNCFMIVGISEIILVPREFVKSIRYIKA